MIPLAHAIGAPAAKANATANTKACLTGPLPEAAPAPPSCVVDNSLATCTKWSDRFQTKRKTRFIVIPLSVELWELNAAKVEQVQKFDTTQPPAPFTGIGDDVTNRQKGDAIVAWRLALAPCTATHHKPAENYYAKIGL